MAITTTDLTPRIGSLLHASKQELLSGQFSDEIRALLEQRSVLVVRGLGFSDADQLQFTKTLGTIAGDDLYTVTLDEKVNPEFAKYNRIGNFSWHMDRTDLDMPPLCSMLRAEQVSATGGETQFASTYAAYEDLTKQEKVAFDKLKVLHLLESSFRETVPHPTEAQLAEWRKYPSQVHPLIWHHKSGRNSLATSTSATEVIGMAKKEGASLLRRLLEWATQPQYVYTHHWQVGDVVFWDNTGTMHKALPYDADSGRCLKRTTLVGEEAIN